MKNKTIIHIITGDGKGKTSASLGLALRAVGADKKVKLIQFMKTPDFSEHKAIAKYGLPIEIECFGIGFYQILGDTHTKEEHQKACQAGLKAAEKAIQSKKYDLIILDEINVAISLNLLDVHEVLSLINPIVTPTRCNNGVKDIVLTGRGAHFKLKKIADLVSDIRKVKHYFDDGLEARKGIEF